MSIGSPGETLRQGVLVVTSIAFETRISLPRLPHRPDGSKLDSSLGISRRRAEAPARGIGPNCARMHKAEPYATAHGQAGRPALLE